MDIYPKNISPLGYQTGQNGIDTYGVNHNNFSLRDELEYQYARQKRENQLMQQYNNQDITSNYPQYTTNFWGNSANNYGFGNSNIENNITNVLNPLNNNLNQGVQYAQNNLPSTANDATYNPNYISDNDLYKKWNNPLYGTNWDIIQDSLKDLGNDAIGIARGWSANNINDCNYLLPAYARKR